MGIIFRPSCLLILTFLFSASLVNAQDLQIIYDVHYKASQTQESISKEQMMLGIDPVRKKSYYSSYNRKKNDSITAIINKLGNTPEAEGLISAISSPAFNHIIQKDFNKSEFTLAEEIMTGIYETPYDLNLSWQLVSESKKLLGHDCQKATLNFGGREWIAYYTNDIPVPDGPYKFHGLPGLILEVFDTEGDYHFSAVDIRKIRPNQPGYKFIKINNKQLQILKKQIMADPASFLRNGSGGGKSGFSMDVSFSGSTSRKPEDIFTRINNEYWEWMKKHDNPIEKGDLWLK